MGAVSYTHLDVYKRQAIVRIFPTGRSAKGWALYSVANLLPYAAIPTIGEKLLPLVGGAPRLFALVGLLGLPALL